jgi:hypothetical protein
VKSPKRPPALPIGRAAKLVFELDAAREGCSKAAKALLSKPSLDQEEFEECVRLDEGLARAQRLLKSTVRSIMLSRISRRSRGSRAR